MARSIYQGVWAHGLDLHLQVENFLKGNRGRGNCHILHITEFV
jgi:hypothetical protein